MSHPSRVRGLKQVYPLPLPLVNKVAPLTGAWIETSNLFDEVEPGQVAPLTGAWIETLGGCWYRKPARVAPLTGAWIETMLSRQKR